MTTHKIALHRYHMKSETHRDNYRIIEVSDTVGEPVAHLSNNPRNSWTLSYEGPFSLPEAERRLAELEAERDNNS